MWKSSEYTPQRRCNRQNFSYWLILMTICLHLSDSNIDSCFFQTEPQNVRCQKQRNLCLVFLDIKIWLHFRCIFLLSTSQEGKRKPWPPSQKDQLWSNQLYSKFDLYLLKSLISYKCFPFKLTPYTKDRKKGSINHTWCLFLIHRWCLGKDIFFFSSFLFFKLCKYDNTFTGNLENTEQSYIQLHYYNYFLSRRFLVWVSISNSQKLTEWTYRKVEGYSRPEKLSEDIFWWWPEKIKTEDIIQSTKKGKNNFKSFFNVLTCSIITSIKKTPTSYYSDILNY